MPRIHDGIVVIPLMPEWEVARIHNCYSYLYIAGILITVVDVAVLPEINDSL